MTLPTRTSDRSSALFPGATVCMILLYVVGVVVMFADVVHRTHGHFTYSLDDAYIHLALSERIRHGLYGLNAGEVSSPASSLIWPFLFAPFADFSFVTALPLLVNIVCGLLLCGLLGGFIDRYVPADGRTGAGRWTGAVLGALLLFGLNIFGLTFIGLEQLLEALLCVCCALLCVRVTEGRPVARWMLAACAVLPSIRYEGFLVTLACGVVLLAAGRRRLALLLTVGSLVPLVIFGLLLHRAGLPPVPISVLIKSAQAVSSEGRHHPLFLVQKTILLLIKESERWPLVVLSAVCVSLLWKVRGNRRLRPLFAATAGLALVQTFAGPFGWLFRYEIYSLAFLVPVLLASQLGGWFHTFAEDTQDRAVDVNASSRPAFLPTHVPAAVSGTVLALMFALAWSYAEAPIAALNAAQSIWRQQGQMALLTHRFYTGPVAINDLGLVAYRRSPNDYVLDLAGLGSPEVFRDKVHGTLEEQLGPLTHDHHIGLVAVYAYWFLVRPPEWKAVGRMCTDEAKYGPAAPCVTFFETPEAKPGEVQAALEQLRGSLDPGSHLEIDPGGMRMTWRTPDAP